ncbi:hypothetical protein POM88_036941 [Heracleum sosnowskyi]|uniref:RPW8 domain-containing protein n=1 Tax=Heracleum sosnowskyi TaxID=360622 RepID=A0AAD8MFH7_9APIA|nr:hypothetical protein POM88_036941 [Heracleum sosnowskyi]
MDLFLDAALGTALSELLKLVVTVEKRRGDFRGNLETLKNTLESAIFTLNELEKLNIILSRPEETTRQFINQLSQGVNLVEKCIEIPYWKRYKYSNKLAELAECIEKFFNVGVQGSVAVNTLRNGIGIQEINDKLDFMFKFLNITYEREFHVKKRHEALHSASCGAYLCGVSAWESVQGPPDEFEMLQVDAEIQTHSSDEFSSWVTAPSLPNSVVGLDKEPYEVISGPGSLQDPEIQTLEAGISELLKVVVAVAKLTQNFKTNLRTLSKTLKSVQPIFNDIEKLDIFNRPKEEIHQFKDQVNRGVNVVYQNGRHTVTRRS